MLPKLSLFKYSALHTNLNAFSVTAKFIAVCNMFDTVKLLK